MIDPRNPVTWFPKVGFLSLVLAFVISDLATAYQEHDRAPVELSGFSISEAFDIPDDVPLDLDSPLLKQLLYRIKNTSPDSRARYSRYTRDLDWQDVTTNTEDYRLWLFDIPARLKRIESRPLKNLSSQEEIQRVFVCHCETIANPDQSEVRGKPFLALSRTLPSALPIGTPLDEPIRVVGFLYARVSGVVEGDNNEMPVLITDRVAWHPTESAALNSVAHQRLARHGVDIGLIDHVRANNTLPLGGRDAEAFYQILAAVDRMEPNDVAGDPDSKTGQLGFNELMQDASSNFGESVRVTGTIRSCSVISVPQKDIRDRLGVSRYYQLMLFPDLDGARIVVKNKDGSKLDYRRFPITVCCTELPAGMTPTDMERQSCIVDGFFYRFWKYQSEKTDQLQTSGQVSPLIIAKRPVMFDSDIGRLNTALLIFVVAVITTILALFFGFRIADRRRMAPGTKILDSLPDKIDVSGLDV